jgi:hypothetical protein
MRTGQEQRSFLFMAVKRTYHWLIVFIISWHKLTTNNISCKQGSRVLNPSGGIL